MAYTNVHLTRHDRHRRYSWEIEDSRATLIITSDDQSVRVVLDFETPEAVDQAIGLLTEARNALYDRQAARQVPA